MDFIKRRTLELTDEVRELRRKIHQNPEIGYEEHETAALVANYLRQQGIEVAEGVGGVSVVGLLRGAKPGPCVALRADMDALSVQEETGLPFASQKPGIMHACGHDGHTAMLLVAARILSENRAEIAGTVKFLFQSAEECAPHGGAKYMIEAGALENPRPESVFGLHLWPDVPLGQVGLKEGPIMSASDRIQISVKGKGGHGAIPHQAVDAVYVGSQIVTALQGVVSRQVDPMDAAVVTIGQFNSGSRYNIIAEDAFMDGTVRTQNEDLRGTMPDRIGRIVESVAQAYGAKASLLYEKGFPTLYNHPESVSLAAQAVRDVLGDDGILHVERPSMGGEDFAFFTRELPGSFLWLGCRARGESGFPIHNPRYNFDEAALPIGVELLCRLATVSLGSVAE